MKKSSNKLVSNSLAVILTVAAFLIAWKMVLPTYSDNKTRARNLDTEVREVRNKIASIEAAKTELSDITEVINQLLVAIPEDRDEPNLISELEAIGLKNSIIIPSIDISAATPATSTVVSAAPTTATTLPSGTPITVNFSIIAPADKIMGFTGSLENSVKFMNIKTITMATQDGGNISAAYGIETYTRGTADNGGGTQ